METITVGTDVPQAVNFVAFLNANGISAQVGSTPIDSINGVEVKFGTVEYDIFQSRWADFRKNKINSGVDGLLYINHTYRAHKIDDARLTATEIKRIDELSKLYLESLQGYDGHGMYPGLPRHLAQEYDNLRAKYARRFIIQSGTQSEHELWLSAIDSPDESRAALGRGYRAGLTMEARDPS